MDKSNIINEKLVLGNKPKEEVSRIIKFIINNVSVYRVEEEKESLEKLFISETN